MPSDWSERVDEALSSTRRLVSPEKASLFIDAHRHLREVGVDEEDVLAQVIAKLQ